MNLPKFFAELKRRHVYKVAIAYATVEWLLIDRQYLIDQRSLCPLRLPDFRDKLWPLHRPLMLGCIRNDKHG